jgi:hypothetical protein
VPALERGDFSGRIEVSLSIKRGLEFLESFFRILGLALIGKEVRSYYESKDVQNLKIGFLSPTRETIPPGRLINSLAGFMIRTELLPTLYLEGSRYYVVTAKTVASSITVVAEGNNHRIVSGEALALRLAEVSGAEMSIMGSTAGETIFKGKKGLTIGVELHELIVELPGKELSIVLNSELFKSRDGDGEAILVEVI